MVAGEELVEVVGKDGGVVDVVTRAEIRRRRLRHRAVYIVIRSSGGDLLVHRRAEWKDVFGGWWDLCFGGLCDVGEAWDAAAARELAEEAGVDAPLTPVSDDILWHGDDGAKVLGRVFAGTCDGPFAFADGEVTETRFVPVGAVEAFVHDHDVCPDSRDLVLAHLGLGP